MPTRQYSDKRLLTKMCRTIAKFKAKDDTNWQLIAEEWPTFLYDEEAGWSEGSIRTGLFRGHVLVRVSYFHWHISASLSPLRICLKAALRIFRNKTSADADRLGHWFNPNKRQKGPKCMLERHEIEQVTPSMIAYAALQVNRILPLTMYTLIIVAM
jgi:hypothetical protein